jgi:hypothetical protein
MECVDRKNNLLIQIVRTHQRNTDSTVLQTETSSQNYREKQDKGYYSRGNKNGETKWYMDNPHVPKMKNNSESSRQKQNVQ